MQEECTWDNDSEYEDDDMAEEPGGVAVGGTGSTSQEGLPAQSTQGQHPHIDASYIDIYLLKFMCPNDDCHGTLVPQLGTDKSVCDMCWQARSEAEFMAELQSLAES